MSEMSDLKTRIDNADTGWEQDEDIRQDLLSRYQELKSRRSPVDRAKNAQAVVQIEKLKQICVRGKMAAMKEWINNYLEEQDKLVVFGVHKEVIDLLMEEFKGFAPVKIDGSVSMVNRQAAVDSFQTDPNCKVFVGNIQAAGVGITLTASNSTCFTELGWTPGGHSQAEDRVHRIGQEADSVNAYYIVAKGTIEEKIMLMLDTKTKVLAEVLDGAEVESSSLLSDLLAEYSK
jgi:SWI/SNF-related matrix-associated actin-dependent regulator 1 of chromatin subfamily A